MNEMRRNDVPSLFCSFVPYIFVIKKTAYAVLIILVFDR